MGINLGDYLTSFWNFCLLHEIKTHRNQVLFLHKWCCKCLLRNYFYNNTRKQKTLVATTEQNKICDVLTFHNLKNREKHPWRSVTVSKVVNSLKVALHHGYFLLFLYCANGPLRVARTLSKTKSYLVCAIILKQCFSILYINREFKWLVNVKIRATGKSIAYIAKQIIVSVKIFMTNMDGPAIFKGSN